MFAPGLHEGPKAELLRVINLLREMEEKLMLMRRIPNW